MSGRVLVEQVSSSMMGMTFTGHGMTVTTRWTSPTTEIFEMYGPAKDGKEMKMMEITYTKK